MSKTRPTTFPPTGGATPQNPFAALENLRGQLPAGADERSVRSIGSGGEEPSVPKALGSKLVLNRERKGRGGKTVTLLRGVALEGEALAAFARELRQALGTGGSVEDGAILLAGDQCTRAEAWLRQRGAARVVIGN